MSTHNLCFEAKHKKKCIPLHTPILLYESGVKGVFITQTCCPDKEADEQLYSVLQLGFEKGRADLC